MSKMIEEGKVHTLTCLVVDELHMVADAHRGYILELLLRSVVAIYDEGFSR